MAQIIKHRRGTAAQLKTVTLQKAELGVSTGSVSGITTPVLHVGDGTNAAGFVVGRLFQGSTVPTLNSGNIGSSLNDLLFHDSATYKLVKLHTSGNETLNLTDNSVANDPETPGAPFGPRYSVRSGSAGTLKASDTREYGKFYPDAGLIVLSANALSSSLPGSPDFQQVADSKFAPFRRYLHLSLRPDFFQQHQFHQ